MITVHFSIFACLCTNVYVEKVKENKTVKEDASNNFGVPSTNVYETEGGKRTAKSAYIQFFLLFCSFLILDDYFTK